MDDPKPGDIVRLKSGSPRMTVTAVGNGTGAKTAWTSWFSGTQAMDGSYPIVALELCPAKRGYDISQLA